MLRLCAVGKQFPGVIALDDISFEIQRGKIHALVGENGAGKSTLMKIRRGVYPDYSGEIHLDGITLHLKTPRDAQRLGIAIIHQELNLIPELSVVENIYLGREPRTHFGTIDRRKALAWTNDLLRRLDLRIDPRRSIASLRVGEQQLVEVAKALSLNARLLILDEPTSSLSLHEINRLFAVIRSLNANGVTMIYISHKFEEIFALSNTVTVLRDGHHIATVPSSETNPRELIRLMVGRELNEMFPKVASRISGDVLRVEHLSSTPPPAVLRRALSGISFSLRSGEILGVAGLMGSGRTELLESIFGVFPRRELSGQVLLADSTRKRRRLRSPGDALHNGIALVSEDRKSKSLVLQLSVGANITMSSLRALSTWGFVRSGRERKVSQDTVAQLRIRTPNTRVLVEHLSGGNQQKVALGRCLLTAPRVLLLDEPTRGIDVGAKAEIYSLISQLAARGTAILMASSELPELLAMCDRILVLRDGQLAATFDGTTTSQEDILAAAVPGARLAQSDHVQESHA